MLGLKVTETGLFAAEIIRKVREKEALSRVELARELGVAASTIGRHVDTLVEKRYFTETVEPTHEAGRPPTRLRPNPHRGCFIGVDFYADGLFATAVDFAQQTIAKKAYPLEGHKGVEHVLDEVSHALAEMRDLAHLPVLSAGLATPGRVDTRRGVGLAYYFVPGWENVPLAEKMSETVGLPVFIENNVRAMSLAERWFGEGRGCSDIICVGVRIGVSAGVVRDGQLATGFRELGGEIRGWSCPVYDAKTEKWSWHPGATIEKFASINTVLSKYKERTGQSIIIKDFLDQARQGNVEALYIVKEVAAIHGWAISQMAQLVDPEKVILAGPLTTLGDVYLKSVTEFAGEFESSFHPSVPIRVSALGEFAGAVGAAALALERWRPADLG